MHGNTIPHRLGIKLTTLAAAQLRALSSTVRAVAKAESLDELGGVGGLAGCDNSFRGSRLLEGGDEVSRGIHGHASIPRGSGIVRAAVLLSSWEQWNVMRFTGTASGSPRERRTCTLYETESAKRTGSCRSSDKR